MFNPEFTLSAENGFIEALVHQSNIPQENRVLLGSIVAKLFAIEPVFGCNERICRACFERSPRGVTSMPLPDIACILSTKRDGSYNTPLHLFMGGDPIYYDWQGYTFASVVHLGLKTKWKINAFTHGCLPGEEIGIRMIKELIELKKRYSDEMADVIGPVKIIFSFDPYGWYDITPEEHLEIVAWNLKQMKLLSPTIIATYNTNDTVGRGSLGNVKQTLKDILLTEYDPCRIHYLPLYTCRPGDRPSHIQPPLPKSEGSHWCDYTIKNNGDVLWYGHYKLDPVFCGNIYGNLTLK